MQSNVFIPSKINVGFQNRDGTFSGKLAYVIYYDEKDNLRQERSWDGWRDKDIPNEEYENTPEEGFVLNKKAGGYSSGWNYRQSYIRVYDPRGFEFEITVKNLLYILENTNSIKGKGLEGKFIYAWDGGDLVLLPTGSPDYKSILEYNKQRHSNKKIGIKDLVIGGTYRTKSNEDYVYMGKFTQWDYDYMGSSDDRLDIDKGQYHFFCKYNRYENEEFIDTIMVKSPSGRFMSIVSEESPVNFADIMNKLERTIVYSPLDESKNKYVKYTVDELKDSYSKQYWVLKFYNEVGDKFELFRIDGKTMQANLNNIPFRIVKRTANNIIYVDEGLIEDLLIRNDFYYKNQYLKNGKLYKEGKYD